MNYPVGGVQVCGDYLCCSLGTVDCQPSIDGHDCELEKNGGNCGFVKIKEDETFSLLAMSTCETPLGMERLGSLCLLMCLSRSLLRLSTSLSIFSRPNLSKAKLVGANMVKGPPSSSDEARSVNSSAFTRTENLGSDLSRLRMLL